MIMKAVLSNKAHPECGQATIPFPIPDSDYDHTIDLLEGIGIGSPTAQDCRVDGLESKHPILNRLTAQNVSVDELDYLAKRLASFCKGEDTQFEAMASKLCLSDIKDLINLTFCCQRATVITDFSDLERIGKTHALTVSGDSLPVEVLEKMDYHDVALDLIRRGAGTVTPYGVVYDNGMKLEQLYDGRHFPAYYVEPCVAAVALSLPGQDGREMLYFPCPDSKINRAVQRLGASTITECTAMLEDAVINDTVLWMFVEEFGLIDTLDTLNRLTRCYQGFHGDDLEKFHTVFDCAWPQTPEEVLYLAEALREFTVITGISTDEEYGRIVADRMGVDSGILEFLDVRSLGQRQITKEQGLWGDKGYIAYNGTRPEIKEIMGRHILPEQEPQMGGLA